MNTRLRRIGAAALIGLWALWSSVWAQTTIYRCGNSYSERPCPDGSVVPAADPRTEAQRQAHDAAVQREKRTAERLEQERLRAEAAAARAAQQADRAQQAAERHAKRAEPAKRKPAAQGSRERLPAYQAPAQPRP